MQFASLCGTKRLSGVLELPQQALPVDGQERAVSQERTGHHGVELVEHSGQNEQIVPPVELVTPKLVLERREPIR
jgi:hypothetical protein